MPFTDSVKMVDVIITDRTELNATPADVLSGKKFIGASKTTTTGSIPVLSPKSDITLVSGESHTVQFGYNPSSYNVNVAPLPDQTVGDATSDEILNEKIAWVNGERIIGSMPNVGAQTITVECGEEIPIEAGYHNGSGMAVGASLASQTEGNATSSDIVMGKTAWVNGEEIMGEIPIYSEMSIIVQAGETVPIPAGFYETDGELIGQDLESQTQASAIPEQIIQDATAWVNGELITGTMVEQPTDPINLPINGSYTIPQGYHTGFGEVTQHIPSNYGETVSPTRDSQTIEVSGYYMEGDIIVNGVDALNYNYDYEIMKTDSEVNISLYELPVDNGVCTINLYGDNWHDNATTNIYKLEFTDLVDSNNNPITLVCQISIVNSSSETIEFGDIQIELGFSNADECQYIQISGITSGKLTMINTFKARVFGVDDSAETYTILFDVSDVQLGIYRIHITESHNPIAIDLTSGDNILEHVMDPDFEVYDENNNLVVNHNISFTGWCTDPSDPTNTKVGQDDTISSNMTLYPMFAELLAD